MSASTFRFVLTFLAGLLVGLLAGGALVGLSSWAPIHSATTSEIGRYQIVPPSADPYRVDTVTGKVDFLSYDAEKKLMYWERTLEGAPGK